jgi:hypothetical protein
MEHEYFRAIRISSWYPNRSRKEAKMDAATQDIVVLAEKSALSEARDVFSQLGAPVQAMPLESPRKIPQSRIFIVYFRSGGPEVKKEFGMASVLYAPSRS